MADSLYLRYCDNQAEDKLVYTPLLEGPSAFADYQTNAAYDEILWIEWKKKGGKAAKHQQDWHAGERYRGALTLIAGENFPASIEGFAEWYAKSGLQRKKMSLPR